MAIGHGLQLTAKATANMGVWKSDQFAEKELEREWQWVRVYHFSQTICERLGECQFAKVRVWEWDMAVCSGLVGLGSIIYCRGRETGKLGGEGTHWAGHRYTTLVARTQINNTSGQERNIPHYLAGHRYTTLVARTQSNHTSGQDTDTQH